MPHRPTLLSKKPSAYSQNTKKDCIDEQVLLRKIIKKYSSLNRRQNTKNNIEKHWHRNCVTAQTKTIEASLASFFRCEFSLQIYVELTGIQSYQFIFDNIIPQI